jgi:predicted ATPase/class 3 adenylate cyclase
VGAPDVTESTPSYPNGTVTFLFTDIGGSTRLWEQAPDAMRVALASHDAILRSCVEARGGVVFKTVGDAVYAAFADPAAAVAASVDAQRELDAHAWPEAVGRIEVRMAIHTGVAAETGGDYFGPPLNRVSRIMSLAFPGQILVSRTSASLIGSALDGGITLRELGVFRLKDLSEPEPTAQVIADGLRADFPPLPSLDARPNNLPYEIASFVGREHELADVQQQLDAKRLVTVAGTGGIGKTRLALQSAANVIDRFADGTWFVELATTETGALAAQAIAMVLGLREESQRAIDDTLANAISSKAMLLVLDGADRVAAPIAALVKNLLSRCPGLHILVTTREPLHLTGEHVVRIGTLDDGPMLFLDRAREVNPDVTADADAIAAIAEICLRLDGIPLAIELAAANAATLAPADILARLRKSLKLLVSRDPTKQERHRTLRAAIAWSFELLSSDEAAALRALAVFDGSFNVPAAAAILAADLDDAQDVCADLAMKSLVWVVGGSHPTRYVLMTTVREYLRESGTGDDVAGAARERHFAHFAEVVGAGERADARMLSQWLAIIDGDVANVRAALTFGLASHATDGAAMAVTLSRYWKTRGFLSEARTFLDRATGLEIDDDALRARLLRRDASFAIEQDDYARARSVNLECRALCERLDDANGVAETFFNEALIDQRMGDSHAALASYDRAIAAFRIARNPYGEALTEHNVILLLLARGEHEHAESRIDAVADTLAEASDEVMTAHFTALRGRLALKRGRFDGATTFYRQALDIQERLGNRMDVAVLHSELAYALVKLNRQDEATHSAKLCIGIGSEIASSSHVILGLEAFFEIALSCAKYEDAAKFFALAESLRGTNNYKAESVRDIATMERALRDEMGSRLDDIIESVRGTDVAAAVGLLSN